MSDLFQYSISWLPLLIGMPQVVPSTCTAARAPSSYALVSIWPSSSWMTPAEVNGPTWSATVQTSSGAASGESAVLTRSSRSTSTSLLTTSIVTFGCSPL